MGLFERKCCDVCGEKLRLLGGVEFGSMSLCPDCADRISPWLDPEEEWDADSLQEHMKWREENRREAENFNITREIGEDMTVFLDEDAGLFAVTDDVDVENADIFSLDDIVECSLEVEEETEEDYDVDEEGNDISYDPPHLCCSYYFHMEILLDHPWISSICFPLNEDAVEVFSEDSVDPDTGEYDPEMDEAYLEYLDMADEIMLALTGEEPVEEGEEDEIVENGEFTVCPYCDSRVKWPADGRCPNCGGALDSGEI